MFRNIQFNTVRILPALSILSVIFLLGCKEDAAKKPGVEITADMQPVKLSHVLETPSQYNGKEVLVTGIISGQCASLCELFIRDGAHKATLQADGFKFPKMEAGKPVTVLARVTVGAEQVVFSALSIDIRSGKKL